MRRVLLIAHHFPPIGGGGVQRSVKFVRHIPDFGYEPVVITTARSPKSRWSPEDLTLNEQIEGVEIHRVPGPEPLPARGWRRRAERLLDRDSDFAKWWNDGVKKAAEDVAPSVDLIVAALGPYESGPPAADIAASFDKPLIVDLRDPWALDEVRLYTSHVHRERDLARMRETFQRSAAIVMNTPEAARLVVERFPELERKLVTSIPNGVDPSDFGGKAQVRNDGKFRIVHAGGLYAELGLSHRRTKTLRRIVGGMPVPGVDLLPRSHVVLLQAIDRLLRKEPELIDLIEVRLVGVMSNLDRRIAERSPIVRIEGFQPHRQTVELLRSADLLFLPMHDLPPGTRARLIPAKTYEYLAAARPILAAVPEGDARDLLSESGAAVVCRPSDAETMAELISDEIGDWRAGRSRRTPRSDVVERFHWHNLMEQMATVMDRVIDDGST